MREVKITDMDYDLWLQLTHTQYRIKRVMAKELRRLGLSPEQSGILFFVRSCGNNAMPIEISRWQLREPQTITSILERMEKKGLIKKTRDKDRKNVLRISLTEKGNQAYEAAIQQSAFRKIMGALSEEKRQALREILSELVEATKKSKRYLDDLAEESY